jgi:Putative transposase
MRSLRGRMKIIAFVVEASEIKKTLTHVGLSVDTPKAHPARGPPQSDLRDNATATEWGVDATHLDAQAQGGSVTLIQRFGSAANLNIHLHCLVLDGVYRTKPNGELVFIPASAPTDQALQLLLRFIIASIMKRLVRQGVLVQEQDQWYVADGIAEVTDTSALRPLQQGSIVYRIAFGPRAGRKVLTLREAMPIDTAATMNANRCVPTSRASACVQPCAATLTSD